MNLKKIFKKWIPAFARMTGEGEVIVRIAPSPTGNLHLGTARTALFNYLFVKQKGGKFVLRIEDTDKERSKKEYEENIIDGLEWLGIHHDEFYRQSEREEVYKKYLKDLVDKKLAYISKEEPKEEGQRDEVIRFKNPNTKVKFTDLIRGDIEFDTTELGDFVIAKSFDEPVFHLAVVVDDHEMGITHVIRGEDHISNTPRQILIQDAIGAKRPLYAHLPLILNQEKAKLSKRDGAMSISEFRDMGYLSDAFINFLAFLGWAPRDERELLSLDELIKEFEIERIQKGGAVFNTEKLDWFNKEYIKKIPDEVLIKNISEQISIDNELLERAIVQIKERINKITHLDSLFLEGGEFDYIIFLPDYEKDKLNWKTNTYEKTKEYLQSVLGLLEKISENSFDEKIIKENVFPYADQEGRGDVLWPYRFALSGKDKSIDPFNLSHILGKQESINRLNNAINKLS